MKNQFIYSTVERAARPLVQHGRAYVKELYGCCDVEPAEAITLLPAVLARNCVYQADHQAAVVGLRIFSKQTMISIEILPTLQVITDEILPVRSTNTAGDVRYSTMNLKMHNRSYAPTIGYCILYLIVPPPWNILYIFSRACFSQVARGLDRRSRDQISLLVRVLEGSRRNISRSQRFSGNHDEAQARSYRRSLSRIQALPCS